MEGVYNNNQGLDYGLVTGFRKHLWEMGLLGTFAKLYELIFCGDLNLKFNISPHLSKLQIF
jgi:hypothetical protein